MRKSADDAQRMINQAIENLGDFDTKVTGSEREFMGHVGTLNSIDELIELAGTSIPERNIDISRDIDSEIMDEVYSALRNNADVSERTVYNWMEKWNGGEGLGLIRGEPSERRITSRGRHAYEMVENQHQALDVASEMKASMIEEVETEIAGSEPRPFIPGNQRLVARYLDDSSLVEKYMQRE